jgi:hypothetical protein
VIRRFGPALLLPAMVLLIAGCGESSMGAISVSKGEFIQQADQICVEADFTQPEELEAFQAKNKEELKKLAAVPYEATVAADFIIPSVKGQIRKLENLQPPAGEGEEYEALLAAWDRAVREGEKDPYTIANFWEPKQDPLVRPNKMATRYGLEVCNELR